RRERARSGRNHHARALPRPARDLTQACAAPPRTLRRRRHHASGRRRARAPPQRRTITGMNDPDSADALRETIERYNDAWNRQDGDAIVSMHAPDFVFHNWTAGEQVEGDAVRPHLERIFANTPNLRFTGRRLYVADGLVVNEWTAHADRDGKEIEW